VQHRAIGAQVPVPGVVFPVDVALSSRRVQEHPSFQWLDPLVNLDRVCAAAANIGINLAVMSDSRLGKMAPSLVGQTDEK